MSQDKPKKSSALHDAINTGNREMIELIIASKTRGNTGLDLDARGPEGNSPILMVIDSDKFNPQQKDQLIGQLIKGGANPDVPILAQSRNGATINTVDEEGKTLLHDAVLKGAEGRVEYLLAKGADPNIKDKNGNTPLLEVYRSNTLDNTQRGSLADQLILAGAKTHEPNNDGLKPTDYMIAREYLTNPKLSPSAATDSAKKALNSILEEPPVQAVDKDGKTLKNQVNLVPTESTQKTMGNSSTHSSTLSTGETADKDGRTSLVMSLLSTEWGTDPGDRLNTKEERATTLLQKNENQGNLDATERVHTSNTISSDTSGTTQLYSIKIEEQTPGAIRKYHTAGPLSQSKTETTETGQSSASEATNQYNTFAGFQANPSSKENISSEQYNYDTSASTTKRYNIEEFQTTASLASHKGVSELHQAIIDRRPLEEIKPLVTQHNVNEQNTNGVTALHLAIRSAGLTKDERNQVKEMGKTMPEEQVRLGVQNLREKRHAQAVAVVEVLLQHGADPMIKTNKGNTAFDSAKFQSSTIIEGMLSKAKEGVNQAREESPRQSQSEAEKPPITTDIKTPTQKGNISPLAASSAVTEESNATWTLAKPQVNPYQSQAHPEKLSVNPAKSQKEKTFMGQLRQIKGKIQGVFNTAKVDQSRTENKTAIEEGKTAKNSTKLNIGKHRGGNSI